MRLDKDQKNYGRVETNRKDSGEAGQSLGKALKG